MIKALEQHHAPGPRSSQHPKFYVSCRSLGYATRMAMTWILLYMYMYSIAFLSHAPSFFQKNCGCYHLLGDEHHPNRRPFSPFLRVGEGWMITRSRFARSKSEQRNRSDLSQTSTRIPVRVCLSSKVRSSRLGLFMLFNHIILHCRTSAKK